MAVTLWQYLPGQKRLIVEDAMTNNRTVVFCKDPGTYELIDSAVQTADIALDHLMTTLVEKDIHVLCNERKIGLKFAEQLKKRNISFRERKEIYKV
jgi:hypothetical protein